MLLLFIVLNTQYQISVRAGVYKNWALQPIKFLKKGIPVGRKIVFRICAFETIRINF